MPLLLIALAAAVSNDVYFPIPPTQTSAKLASLCMDRGTTVAESDDNHVLCTKPISGGKGMLMQMLIGNAYSTPPLYMIRFQIVSYQAGSRVQFSDWVQTQMPGGQVSRMEDTKKKNIDSIRSTLYGIGATAVP